MGTIWIGWDAIIVIAIVMFVTFTIAAILANRAWKKIRANHLSATLVDAGFTWEYRLQGWLSRDPNNDDWILWDERNNRMLRLPSQRNDDWRQSEESLRECIELGKKYSLRLSRVS